MPNSFKELFFFLTFRAEMHHLFHMQDTCRHVIFVKIYNGDMSGSWSGSSTSNASLCFVNPVTCFIQR